MPVKAAIVIGVDRVESGLPPLTAAASGAREVAAWLSRNEYEVDLLTDEAGPVTRLAIFEKVRGRVDAANVERLVIYFAGHGFLNGPNDEYWLLSAAPVDAAEAVNVSLSINMGRYRGIPEIMIISDACRVPPKTTVHTGIRGASIFPNVGNSPSGADIDVYYATRPGDPSYERLETEAQGAHGLFTSALLEAHCGAPPQALLNVDGRNFVRARWLKQVLRDRVDDRAQAISLALTQQPDIQLQTENGFIAQNEEAKLAPPKPPSPPSILPPMMRRTLPSTPPIDSSERRRSLPGLSSRGGMPRTASRKPSAGTSPPVASASPSTPPLTKLVSPAASTDDSFATRVETILSARRESRRAEDDWSLGPETLHCHGDLIVAASTLLGGTQRLSGERLGSILATPLGDDDHGQIAVMFTDGSGMFLPVLREYRCDIIRRRGRTISLSYSWLGSNSARVESLRADVLSAASLGFLNLSREAIAEFAGKIRQDKKIDPMLGLVAILAYTMIGDAESARSVRSYMRDDNRAELFDTWLLGGGASDDADPRPVVPPVPLLSQTWSYLDAFDSPIEEEMKRLARVPGFWTVFDEAAMADVMEMGRQHLR